MKKNLLVYFFHAAATAASIFLLSGCASNGYITSSINTGIGLDVSENPQTQVPHVRFGYIRTGLYYIPTGKTGNPVNGDASQTPHVVSKIHVSSEFLKNLDITEKFAVGEKATKSDAARQLFADTSSETRGKTVQAPLIAAGRSTEPFVGDVERSHSVPVTNDGRSLPSISKLMNPVNRDFKPLDDTTAAPILDNAKKQELIKGDFTASPQGATEGDKAYLFRIFQINKDIHDEIARPKLAVWRSLIPPSSQKTTPPVKPEIH